jgi:hypothetical protein
VRAGSLMGAPGPADQATFRPPRYPYSTLA